MFAIITSFENIMVNGCDNLKCLPHELHKLSRLQQIEIRNCPSLVSFPERGLPSTNLTAVCVINCEKLEALLNGIHRLTSHQQLTVEQCPGIVAIPENDYPTNLTILKITDVNIFKSLFQWGLHRLNSLKELIVNGEFPDMISFPQEEIGSTSLTRLWIRDFQNLEYISSTVLDLHFCNYIPRDVLC